MKRPVKAVSILAVIALIILAGLMIYFDELMQVILTFVLSMGIIFIVESLQK
jgi:hypothetical protein